MSEEYMQIPVPPSLWHGSCTQRVLLPAQSQDLTTDVVIIGAGIAGLSAALQFSKKKIDCIVLEAQQPGWGASGRNGGMVIPGLKYDPEELVEQYGSTADSLIDMVGGAADFVFDLIRKYGIDCDARQDGWIQTAHNKSLLKLIEKKVDQWQKRGANVRLLGEKEVQEKVGSNQYIGGWIDYRAGVLNPLKYTLGLQNKARELGAKIFGDNRALSVTRESNGWCVATENGYVVRADKVFIATNGYTDDLWPNLRKTILPANSFVIATEPLKKSIRQRVLPYGQACTDSRRLLVYFRYDNEGRFIFGGRGTINEPHSAKQWLHIEKGMHDIFPELKYAAIQYRWAGRVGVTKDALAHVHKPAQGVYALLGFNGRGVALATTMGAKLAESMIADKTDVLPYPVTPIKPIPLHALHKFYIGAGMAWFRFLDRLG